MKKTLLVTLDFPPNLGGVAAYYYNVCKNLPADKIVVLAPEQEGAHDFDLKQHFPIVRKNLIKHLPNQTASNLAGLSKISATFKWLSIIKHIKQVATSHKIDLIAVGQILPLGTLALLCQKRRHIPYVVFTHGLDVTLPQNFKRKKLLLQKIIDNAQAIIANSYFTKDELTKLGANPQKVTVVYPCPNLIQEQPSEWKLEELIHDLNLKDKKIILSVGRLIARKGYDMIIRALPQVIKQIPQAVYLIIGSGPSQKILEDLVNQNGLRDQVKFLGAVPQHDLSAYYYLCHVLAMPNRQLENGDVEGFGTVFLEANLFGKPVIGGRSGGAPEAIINGKTGLLVSPTSVDEITAALIKILSDPAYGERLGMQGLERVVNEFDWPTQTEKIKEILK